MINKFLYNDALHEARKAQKMRYRHGAVLVSKSGKVISKGYNRYSLNRDFKNIEQKVRDKLSFDGKFSVHAEVDCFSKLNFNQKLIKGSTLFIYGESKCKNTVKSRPCPNCMKLIRFLRIRTVVYSHTRDTSVVERVEL